MTESFTSRGGRWVVGQSVLMLGVFALGIIFHGPWRSAATLIPGVALFGLGGWIGIAGVRALGRNRTPYPKPVEGSTLVQHGVYGRVRHPLYCSVIFISVGWALAWSSGAALAVSLALAALLDAKSRREERWLREKFPAYAAYASRVPRLLPWIY
jgi:protein-S-isoprenylcysteine O-methyltransferase Ste14